MQKLDKLFVRSEKQWKKDSVFYENACLSGPPILTDMGSESYRQETTVTTVRKLSTNAQHSVAMAGVMTSSNAYCWGKLRNG